MTGFDHLVDLEFSYDDPGVARRVTASVRPEVGAIEGGRSRATLSRDGDTVAVTVEAADPTALRAASNTWLRLVSVAERIAVSAPRGDR